MFDFFQFRLEDRGAPTVISIRQRRRCHRLIHNDRTFVDFLFHFLLVFTPQLGQFAEGIADVRFRLLI